MTDQPKESPKPTIAERLKLAFARLRNTAGMFNTEAVHELEEIMADFDTRLAAVEAKVNPPAPPPAQAAS